MLQGNRIDLGSFLVNQLNSAATSSAHRIVIGGLITPIATLAGVKPNPDDRVIGPERLKLVAFKQIKFSDVIGFILGTGLCHSQMLIAPLS